MAAGVFDLALIGVRSSLAGALAPGDPLVPLVAFVFAGLVSAVTFAVAGRGPHRRGMLFAAALLVALACSWLLLMTLGRLDTSGITATAIWYGALPLSIVIAALVASLSRLPDAAVKRAARDSAIVAAAIAVGVALLTAAARIPVLT